MTAAAAAPPARRSGRLDLVQLFFNGSGRIGRATFAAALLVVGLTWRGWRGTPGRWPHRLLDAPVLVVLTAAACAVLSKRLHDLGLAGWWSAAPLAVFMVATSGPAPSGRLALAAGWLLIVALATLAAWPGSPRFNRFGPSPREPAPG